MKHEGIGGVTRFVIMNNIFNSPYEPVEKFDLKVNTFFPKFSNLRFRIDKSIFLSPTPRDHVLRQ